VDKVPKLFRLSYLRWSNRFHAHRVAWAHTCENSSRRK